MGLAGVLHQVVEHLLKLARIADRACAAVLEVDLESNAGFAGRRGILTMIGRANSPFAGTLSSKTSELAGREARIHQ